MAIDSIGSSISINRSVNSVQQASERISSGSQINSAADNAAGLAISNRLSAQINEFSQAAINANDGVSYLQVAEGGLSSITDSLQRIRELSLQAANGTLADSDRQALNSEAQQLKTEIQDTVSRTEFNGHAVLKNDESVGIKVGGAEEDTVSVSVDNFATLFKDANLDDLDLLTVQGAQSALDTVDTLQESVDSSVSGIGTQTNRLESAVSSLFQSQESAIASRSRIQDADLAKEISELASAEIKQNITIAMQSQANAKEGDVLRLLDGG